MKQTVCIQNPAKLSVRHSSLTVDSNCGYTELPLEDIWVVIIETHLAQISSAALSAIVDAGIGVMICGSNHMPNGILLPLGAHSRHAQIVKNQLEMSKPLKKRLWQRIVQAKILNQAKVLELLGLESKPIKKIASSVKSGDVDNRESVAAAMYFTQLIQDGTRRDSCRTSPLDYGYSVLRAGIGRAAVGGGWLVSQGIHHANNLNAFNLVDDLIEPFRPVIDLMVMEEKITGPLSPADKAILASIFECSVIVENRKYSVQSAINLELESLRKAVLCDDATQLALPLITEYEKTQGE